MEENSITNTLTPVQQTTEFATVLNMIRQAHSNVMRMANTALIDLYWNLGKHISERVSASEWGKGVVAQLAKYIASNEPNTRGFSAQNLWRMKQFYETYCNNEKLSLIMREISWTNNLIIMSKAKSDEETEFYMRLCVAERLKTKELERQFASCLYERTVLGEPKLSSALREIAPQAASVFRDTYVMEFISGKEAKPENSLRKSMLRKMKQLILELGKDFIAIEEEYRVQVGNHDYRIDLLFYHRRLQCLVAFELKTEEFEPEHLGKINFYLEALDRDVRYENENPSIGVLLCKNKDDEVVEYAMSRSLSPTLVAQYELALPDKKLLQQRVHEIYQQSLEELENPT
ncbi:MAG: DUF1016 domain-containing protein [Bacteroidaceae bacterium]|nr:DUF1016 domain-containing protein [Bacteroidaceae bacterium]